MPGSRLASTRSRSACALAAAVTASAVFAINALYAQTTTTAGQPGVAPRPATQAVGGGGTPANPMERAADSGAQIYVDDSFSAVDKLSEAANKAKQGQFEIAI